MIAIGDKLPAGEFHVMGASGPEKVSADSLFAGRKVAMFGVPGAFTPTCHAQHVPSFVGAADDLKAKGVEEIVCLSVNDPFVMGAWGEALNASSAGMKMLADADASYTKALGLDFDGSAVGLISRTLRFSLYAEDGVVKALNVEEAPGQCGITKGEALVDQI